jgi:hypothetical protein
MLLELSEAEPPPVEPPASVPCVPESVPIFADPAFPSAVLEPVVPVVVDDPVVPLVLEPPLMLDPLAVSELFLPALPPLLLLLGVLLMAPPVPPPVPCAIVEPANAMAASKQAIEVFVMSVPRV